MSLFLIFIFNFLLNIFPENFKIDIVKMHVSIFYCTIIMTRIMKLLLFVFLGYIHKSYDLLVIHQWRKELDYKDYLK